MKRNPVVSERRRRRQVRNNPRSRNPYKLPPEREIGEQGAGIDELYVMGGQRESRSSDAAVASYVAYSDVTD